MLTTIKRNIVFLLLLIPFYWFYTINIITSIKQGRYHYKIYFKTNILFFFDKKTKIRNNHYFEFLIKIKYNPDRQKFNIKIMIIVVFFVAQNTAVNPLLKIFFFGW